MQQYIWLTVLTLVQIIYILVNRKNGKVKYNPHPPGEADKCIKHGEMLATLSEAVDGIERRLDRIENKLNGRIKL